MNKFKLTILLMLAITIVVGLIIYNVRRNFKDTSPYPNSKEWCLKEGGRPVFVGYSRSWNCEFEKEGE